MALRLLPTPADIRPAKNRRKMQAPVIYLIILEGKIWLIVFIVSIKFIVENISESLQRHISIRKDGIFYNSRLMRDFAHGLRLMCLHEA